MSEVITLATLSADHIRPIVGEAVEIVLPDGRTVSGSISSLEASKGPPAPGFRAPFSFSLDTDDPSPTIPTQGSVRMSHPTLGTLEFVAVPSAKTTRGYAWYVVFG